MPDKMLLVLPMRERRLIRQHPEWPDSIPFALLDEERAQTNHGYSLAQLADRGGLIPQAMLANIRGVGVWDNRLPFKASMMELTKHIQEQNQ